MQVIYDGNDGLVRSWTAATAFGRLSTGVYEHKPASSAASDICESFFCRFFGGELELRAACGWNKATLSKA